MEAIGLNKIKIQSNIPIKNLVFFKIDSQVNEHAYLKLSAILDDSKTNEFLYKSLYNQSISILCNFEKNYIKIYTGKIIEFNVVFKNFTYFLEAVCVSFTYEFDIKKKSRSFQDAQMTYKQVINQTAQGTGHVVITKGNNQSINYPIIQYEETDWQFIKRLASRFTTILIPEIAEGYPQFSFGQISGKRYQIENIKSYECFKTISNYRLKSEERGSSINQYLYYKIKTYCHFNLGDHIAFKGFDFLVLGKEVKLVGSLLEFTYTIGSEEVFGLKKQYNDKLSGLTLTGRVLWTSYEKVKVKLDIDEAQDVDTAYPFSFVPLTGNIMYAMPEKGARISIYSPNRDESNTIAVGGKQPKLNFPHQFTKYLVTPRGKQLMINPGRLCFKILKKNTNHEMSIADRIGAEFKTNKNIYMRSPKTISITSNDFVYFKGGTAINLVQSETSHIKISENTVIINTPLLHTSAGRSIGMTEYPPTVKKVQMPEIATPTAVLGGLTYGSVSQSAAVVLGSIPVSNLPGAKFNSAQNAKAFSAH